MRRALPLIAFLVVAVAIGPVAGQLPPRFEKKTETKTETKAADKAPVEVPLRGDEDVLKAVNLKTDPASLLDYLRKQTHPEADPKQMDALIRDLGDDIFQTREAAYSKIITLGKTALVSLKEAAERDPDPEIKHRAGDLRHMLEAKVEPAIHVASVRLLSKMKPAGAAEVLLAFLPCAPDLSVTEEVCKAIDATAVVDGRVEPVIVASLADTKSIRRAAAAQAIIMAKNAEYLPGARKLLKDADPLVRLRVGLALVQTHDAVAVSDALPALIECLDHLPPENLWRVEDILIRLAGEGKGPNVSLGTNEQSRKAAFDAWSQWYAKSSKDIDLAKLDLSEPYLGRTLIIFRNFNRINGGVPINGRFGRFGGEIVEIDKNKEVKWRLPLDDCDPVDAQIVPDNPNEVVIAEYQKSRVTIRDYTKKDHPIVWEKNFGAGSYPIGVQALSDGKIFVVLQNRLLEIDRATKAERVIHRRPNLDIFRAKRTKNGDVVFVTNSGQCIRLSADGTQTNQFQGPNMPVIFGGIDVLPNGNVVLPDFQGRRVVEYDPKGNQVAQISTEWPSAASRLPNGNTLVASQNTRRVVEFNRDGVDVWSHAVDGQVFNVRRQHGPATSGERRGLRPDECRFAMGGTGWARNAGEARAGHEVFRCAPRRDPTWHRSGPIAL